MNRTDIDRSNGYEGIATEFLATRGNARFTGVGVKHVQAWARTLPGGATVIDIGCGSGLPIAEVLLSEGLQVFGIDAAPSFVEAFRHNLAGIPVACEAVQDSTFFNRPFDAALAWGLVFLLSPEDQGRLIRRFADILVPEGRLLFTAPAIPCQWNDAMTGEKSTSLGCAEYCRLLSEAGFSVEREYEDEGENHYFEASKPGAGDLPR